MDSSQMREVSMRFASCLLVLGLSLAQVSCDQTEKMRQTIDQRAEEAKQHLESARGPSPQAVHFDPLTVSNKIWSGNSAVRMHHGIPLPERFEEARGITLVSSDPMTLSDIANAVSAQTGIPIRLSAMTAGGRAGAPPAPIPGLPAGAPLPSSGPEVPMSYEGPLSGLLDRLSASFGISWRFDGSSISISRYETRVFVVEALPGTQELTEGMDDEGSTSGSSASSSGSSSESSLTQNSTTKMELKYWEELTAVLNTLVGGQGTAIVSPTMGTVTVTTTPDVMTTVADYISKENKRLSRQIAINVQIYTVNLTNSEDFNLTFTGALRKLTGDITDLDFNSAAAPGLLNSSLATSMGELSIAVIKPGSDPRFTDIMFQALSAIGDTTQVAQFPMTTLNNHPVSRRVGTDTNYISSVDTNTTSTTSTVTTYTPVVATIHDGFSLQLTPRLLDDGRILLQYSLSLIGIDSMGRTLFDTGGMEVPISLPITDNRIFVQQSMLKSGQTLVIGGVDQDKLAQNKQGVGSPDNFLLGGGTSTQQNHVMMVMTITPQVLDVGADEEPR